VTETRPYLVCPTCEHVERPADGDPAGDETVTCPDCGSERAYHASDPVVPDARREAYVKLDADSAEDT